MKNITEYNEFVKLSKNTHKINEEVDKDTGKAGGGGDMYFANVKGNLAGAENTLVGAAALKLLGFIKRKGLQMYMKRVLKPKLGRIYMNGILRYANKNDIGNFARKKYFNIKKYQKVENEEGKIENKAVKYKKEVTFIKDDERGLKSFQNGATVKTDSGENLENGKYILVYNNGIFVVSGGTITEIEEGSEIKPVDTNTGDTEPNDKTDTTVSDDEFEEYKRKLEKELAEAEKNGIKPEKWVVDEVSEIKSKLDTNIDTIDDVDAEKIQKEKMNLKSGIDILNKSIEEINDIISKGGDGIENINDIRWQKLIYVANMKKLMKLSKFLSDLIQEYNKRKSTSKKKPIPRRSKTEVKKPVVKKDSDAKKESYSLFEAEAPVVVKDKNLNKQNISPTKGGRPDVKTSVLGDDLQEIAKKGEAIDLNAEEFYKQFESEEARKGVTNEILKDKAAMAKVQLAADRIIGGNAKQQNAWDKMVENVKSMYSKYMDTDLVDPKNVIKSTSEVDLAKLKKEQGSSQDGQNLSGIQDSMKLDKVSLWTDSTKEQKNLGESFNDNEYLIANIFINKIHNYYVIQRIKKMNDMYFYRLLGIVDMDKLIEDYEKYNDGTLKDFKDIFSLNSYSKYLSPIKNPRDGARFVTLYIVTSSVLTYGPNPNASILYLYSEKTDNVNFNKDTTFYTLKRADEEVEAVRLPSSGDFNKKDYTFAVTVQTVNSRKITNPNLFGIDANQQFDISSEMSVNKMKGIETIYKK